MKSVLLSSEEEGDGGDGEYDDLDALASINRALNSVGLSSLAHINRNKRRTGKNSAYIKQGYDLVHPSLLLHD